MIELLLATVGVVLLAAWCDIRELRWHARNHMAGEGRYFRLSRKALGALPDWPRAQLLRDEFNTEATP